MRPKSKSRAWFDPTIEVPGREAPASRRGYPLDQAFAAVDLNWCDHVETAPSPLRPDKPLQLIGHTDKARVMPGWRPHIAFADLIREMTLSELQSQ